MGFKRCIQPDVLKEGKALTAAMVGIGMNFSETPLRDANIEDTLLAASVEGMERDDLRTLAVLTTWLGVHLAYVNADRLVQLVAAHTSKRVRAYWGSIAAWQATDHRFARLRTAHKGRRMDLLAVGTEFQVGRHGEDPRFKGGPLRVAANTLRDRPQDILTPSQVARRHRAYRCRVLLGPSYRADMWALLEEDPSITASELARKAYGSVATAWTAKQQWAVLHGGEQARQGAGAP